MDIAISANSRMREWGTASAEAATAGANFVSGLDTFENRRCGNAEAGQNGGIRESLIVTEPFRSTSGIEDPYGTLLWVNHPNGLGTMRQIKVYLVVKT
jgi:hypothetical protein